VVLSSPIELSDTHCHLNFTEYNLDRDLVIEQAKENGITRILIPGIDIETSKTAIYYSEKYPSVYAAVGIHPNSGNSWSESSLSELRRLAENPKVVAIGEIGLDYYRKFTTKSLQKKVFKNQLKLAKELGLPVIVHNREASQDILDIIRTWYQELLDDKLSLLNNPGVMHSFSDNFILARQFIGLRFKIGITGPITYRNADLIQEVVKKQELDNLLLETDAPYLSPHPFRGKRNEPANVKIIAEKIAEIKECSIKDVAKITSAGGNQLFNWRVSH
jgi:TatD DNase family protein